MVGAILEESEEVLKDMKRRNSIFVIAFISIGILGILLPFLPKNLDFIKCPKSADSSDSFVVYHLVDLGKYVKVVELKQSHFSHRVFFTDEIITRSTDESVVDAFSKFDYIQEKVFAGRDRANTYWFIKKGEVSDTLLYHPEYNTSIEFQTGLFPARLLYDKEYIEINHLLCKNPKSFNSTYYGFFLDLYDGHIYLRPLGGQTITELERKHL